MTGTVIEGTPSTADARSAEQHGSHIWYELMTTDPDGAKRFYEAIVPGLTVGERLPGDQDYRIIGRSDGGSLGGVLGLTEEMRSHGTKPVWMGYVGVDDVDAIISRIEVMGGKVLMPAFDIPQGRIAMVADPQGASFYVMNPIPPADQLNAVSDVFSPDAEQRVAWNELQTTDQEGARRFYAELFGWTSDDFMPMGELGEYRFWDYRGRRLGAVFDPRNEGFDAKNARKAYWRYYIRIPSIGAAKEAAGQNGGTIAMGPHQVPTGDWILVGTDPQGAEFALVGKL